MSAEATTPGLEPALAAAWLTDCPLPLAAVAQDGTLAWANAACGALLRLPADAIGRPLAGLLALCSADAPLLAQVLAEGGNAELRQRGPGERIAWLGVQARPGAGPMRLLAWQDLARARGAEAEVERLAELLDLVRESGRIGLWERDLPQGTGRWDRNVFRMMGMEGEGESPPWPDVQRNVHQADREVSARTWQASTCQPGSYGYRVRIHAPDGSLRHLHSRWQVHAGPDGLPARAMGILSDETEAWNLARTHDAMASQLALAVDLARIAIWRHDLLTDRLHCNAQAGAVLGLAPRPEGLPIGEVRALIHPDDLGHVVSSAEAALRGDDLPDMETRYRRPDGGWRTVLTRRAVQRDADGRPLALLGVALDVTERRQAEMALHQASERALLAARGAGLGTWEYDLRSGSIFWDEQMWLLRGLAPRVTPPDGEGRLALVHPEDREATRQATCQSMKNAAPVNHEFRIVRPDGSVRWLASRSTPVHDEQGRVLRFIGVNWDVTDRRTAEAERHEREAAQHESLAKSRFLARMSHELRTPLNAVLGFTQLLLREAGHVDLEHCLRRLQHIRAAGQHLLDLINDVLDLSSLEGGEVRIATQPVALEPLVAETLVLLEPLAREHQVQLHTQAQGVVVLGDAVRLRQVLLNLLSNAVKYNRPGGRVMLEAACRGSSVIVRVADTGRGMDEQQLRHLFEPFNRLGNEREGIEGTGIGLAIVKALVERMGGSVHVDSTPGVGSLFELRLADGSQAPPAPALAEPALRMLPRAEARQRGSLLYIEDNPVNAQIIRELIARRPDLALAVAVDGLSGVAQAAALRPDLVLLDMQLPDIDGHEVLRRLRANPATAAIPVIALSANAMPHDIERALQAGLSDYWTKPLDFRLFMASIEQLFGPG